MKKSMILLVIGLVLGTTSCVTNSGSTDDYTWAPPTGLGRGIVNIVTSPGEIVRDMSYYGNMAYADHPQLGGIDGAIFGMIPGSVFTLVRAADGVLDCFTLGIWGNATHCDFFPTFFWDDLWKPDTPFD